MVELYIPIIIPLNFRQRTMAMPAAGALLRVGCARAAGYILLQIARNSECAQFA
jgi:hypothetical protein